MDTSLISQFQPADLVTQVVLFALVLETAFLAQILPSSLFKDNVVTLVDPDALSAEMTFVNCVWRELFGQEEAATISAHQDQAPSTENVSAAVAICSKVPVFQFALLAMQL